MYSQLRELLKVAESIGTIEKVTMSESRGWIDLEGETSDGAPFHLSLSVEEKR